jgi:hypothetical protein
MNITQYIEIEKKLSENQSLIPSILELSIISGISYEVLLKFKPNEFDELREKFYDNEEVKQLSIEGKEMPNLSESDITMWHWYNIEEIIKNKDLGEAEKALNMTAVLISPEFTNKSFEESLEKLKNIRAGSIILYIDTFLKKKEMLNHTSHKFSNLEESLNLKTLKKMVVERYVLLQKLSYKKDMGGITKLMYWLIITLLISPLYIKVQYWRFLSFYRSKFSKTKLKKMMKNIKN